MRIFSRIEGGFSLLRLWRNKLIQLEPTSEQNIYYILLTKLIDFDATLIFRTTEPLKMFCFSTNICVVWSPPEWCDPLQWRDPLQSDVIHSIEGFNLLIPPRLTTTRMYVLICVTFIVLYASIPGLHSNKQLRCESNLRLKAKLVW